MDKVQKHTHNGMDSDRLHAARALIGAPAAAISEPSGGSTVDAEARQAISDIISALQSLGLTQ